MADDAGLGTLAADAVSDPPVQTADGWWVWKDPQTGATRTASQLPPGMAPAPQATPTAPSLAEDLSRSSVLPQGAGAQVPAQFPENLRKAYPEPKQAEARAYYPTVPEKIGYAARDALGNVLTPQAAEHFADVAKEVSGFVPGLGEGIAAGDTARDLALGDYLHAPISAAGLIIPGASKVAGKVAGKVGEVVANKAAVKQAVADVQAMPRMPVVGPSSALPDYVKYSYSGPAIRKGNAGKENPANLAVQTVDDPQRMMYPGIYRDPREIARIASERVAPEDPAMKLLWGVNRDDLEQIAKGRVGLGVPNVTGLAPNPKGALSAQRIMNPRNEQRLIDTLVEGGKYPGLRQTDAWYVMDPMYQRLEQMFGPTEAVKRYRDLNASMSSFSPSSDVLTEIQRGTGAHWLNSQGRLDDFRNFAGLPERLGKDAKPGAQSRQSLGDAFPADMRYIVGHPYQGSAQLPMLDRYLRTGEMSSDAAKVAAYEMASGVPQTGFQTRFAVGDAHYSRGTGLADTRKGPTDVQASWTPQEYQTLVPWWHNKIARPVGIEPVSAQSRIWNILGPQTGVDTALGPGKLELLSQQIMVAARRLGISPELARDKVLKGEIGAGMFAGTSLGLGSQLSGAGAPTQQQQDQRM